MLCAAFFLAWCRLCWLSVLTGQVAVMVKPDLDERREQRLPRLLLLVREHHRQHAVVAQDAVALAEGAGHQLAVVTSEPPHAPSAADRSIGSESADVDDSLFIVVAEVSGEPVRVAMSLRALEPDIEEIGQLGVLHVVVVRWIDDNSRNGVIRECRQRRG